MCSVKECNDEKIKALGYCSKHYFRHYRGQDPSARSDKEIPVEERFWMKVNTRGPLPNFEDPRVRMGEEGGRCWQWQSPRSDGYGTIWVNGKNVYAHIFSYQMHCGPVGDGLELDHLCRNHSCVNPRHMEAVSHRENISRGVNSKTLGEWRT